ncbi:MAG: hypothetical protein KDC36_06005 [Thermoleophilia bacterium]|nr:hypothetical protein [Thermoleophilia bacterium]
MRPERGVQGHHRSETPVCYRCSLPLLDDAEYCPYCEQPLDLDREFSQLEVTGRDRRVPQRVLLALGLVVLSALAVVTFVLALAS